MTCPVAYQAAHLRSSDAHCPSNPVVAAPANLKAVTAIHYSAAFSRALETTTTATAAHCHETIPLTTP